MVKITYQVPKGSGFRKFVLLMIVAVAMMGMVGSVNGDVTIAPILSSDLLVSNPTENTNAYYDIAFDGTNYLITWGNPLGGIYGNRIQGRFITPDGVMGSGSFDIQSQNSNSWSRVAYNGQTYLVAYENVYGHSHLCGRMISKEGTVGPEFTISDIGTSGVNIGTNGTDFLIIWNDQRDYNIGNYFDIYGQRVASDGSLIGDNFRISPAEGSQSSASIASDGRDYFIVWMNDPYPNAYVYDIYGTRVTADGVVLDSPPIAISTASGYQGAHGPVIEYGNGKYLVVGQAKSWAFQFHSWNEIRD